jgi:hypothetical protein
MIQITLRSRQKLTLGSMEGVDKTYDRLGFLSTP